MPEYWENPLHPGIPSPIPQMPIETWAARRASHLAETIARAEAEVMATRASAVAIDAKMEPWRAKAERAAAMQGEAEQYLAALRAQAAAEFPDRDAWQAELDAAYGRVATATPAPPRSDLAPLTVKRHWWSRRKTVAPANAVAYADVAEVRAEGN